MDFIKTHKNTILIDIIIKKVYIIYAINNKHYRKQEHW